LKYSVYTHNLFIKEDIAVAFKKPMLSLVYTSVLVIFLTLHWIHNDCIAWWM